MYVFDSHEVIVLVHLEERLSAYYFQSPLAPVTVSDFLDFPHVATSLVPPSLVICQISQYPSSTGSEVLPRICAQILYCIPVCCLLNLSVFSYPISGNYRLYP
jgi:hypothetical protein